MTSTVVPDHENGQEMWEGIVRSYEENPAFWSDFETSFIKSIKKPYPELAWGQKEVISRLYVKLADI